MINGASIELFPLHQGVSFRGHRGRPSHGLAGRPLLAPSISPAKNVGITLHGFFAGGMMEAEPQQGLTLILGRARAGDEGARGELVALVYDELRRVASRPDAARAGRPHPLAHRGGPRGRDPAAGRGGLRQGGGPELPVRIGGAGHAGGAHRPRAAAGRRPPRRGPAARAARRGGGLLRGAGAGSSSRSTRPSTGWPSWTGGRRRS